MAVCVLTLLGEAAFAQRNLKNIPDPDPEIERKSFIMPEGVEVNLFASDPVIAKPIQMNFDPQGRFWIASSEVYPHIAPGEQAKDRVLIVEDKDGDGYADSTKVFAGGLLIPTAGLCCRDTATLRGCGTPKPANCSVNGKARRPPSPARRMTGGLRGVTWPRRQWSHSTSRRC